jgi:molecular chaperone GrpE
MVDNVTLNDAMHIPPTPSQQDDSPACEAVCAGAAQDMGLDADNTASSEIVPQDSSGGSEESSASSDSTVSAEVEAVTKVTPEEEEAQADQEEDETPVPAALFRQLLLEKEDLYDRFLRKQAEFENFRKRLERDRQDLRDYALLEFIKDLLPVIDGLERGLEAPHGESVDGYKKGIELILKQLREVLAAAGLQPIRAIGRIFDPNYHQAVLREESPILAENEVIGELQRGYIFKDRLLRPSMVKVAVPVAAEAAEAKPIETEA